MAKKSSAKTKKASNRKTKTKKAAAAKKPAKRKSITARAKVSPAKKASSKPARKKKRALEPEAALPYEPGTSPRGRGVGAGAAGQSGDIQGISRHEDVDSESVEELAEEGQDFEAEVVSGVEDALDPDQGEVRTHEVPEDDVPRGYDEQ